MIAALNGDVDNYADLKALESLRVPPEITTDAKVIPALVSRRIAVGHREHRGVPFDRRVVRGVGRDRRRCRFRPRPRPARTAGQRSGPLRGPRRRHVRDRERAVRRGRGVRPVHAARRRDHARSREPGLAGPGGRARRAAGGIDRRHRAPVVRRTRTPGVGRRAADTRDHDARRRPRRRRALPPQGDGRGAGLVPQDAARPDRRPRRTARRAAPGRDALRGHARASCTRERSGACS